MEHVHMLMERQGQADHFVYHGTYAKRRTCEYEAERRNSDADTATGVRYYVASFPIDESHTVDPPEETRDYTGRGSLCMLSHVSSKGALPVSVYTDEATAAYILEAKNAYEGEEGPPLYQLSFVEVDASDSPDDDFGVAVAACGPDDDDAGSWK